MAEKSKIEWTEATWNPITGCTIVSAGCTNCYAMKLAGTRLREHPTRKGLTQDGKAGLVWTGEVRFNEKMLTDPLRWKRPRHIFVCAHGDLFHENVPDAWIDKVFAVMALCPQHTFQVLTKRPERMRDYLSHHDRSWQIAREFLRMFAIERIIPGHCITNDRLPLAENQPDDHPLLKNWPLPNVWLGVSAENQKTADKRVPLLLDTPATIRWVSAEPLLGPVDFRHRPATGGRYDDWLAGEHWYPGAGSINSETYRDHPRLNWLVVGGESGKNARPMHPDWARSIRNQCKGAGVPFFFKQWGEWLPVDTWRRALRGKDMIATRATGGLCDDYADEFERDGQRFERLGKKAAGRMLDGVEHNAMPEGR